MDQSSSAKAIFEQTIKKILIKKNLSCEEAFTAFRLILNEELGIANEVSFGALFAALQVKGPTVEEIIGLTRVVLEYDRNAIEFEDSENLAGIVGSGKDDLKTFNISTASALVAAAAGFKIVKNGSRSETSIAGTTDVLENLGFKINLNSKEVLNLLSETNFTFCDAISYFPKMGKLYVGKFLFPHPLSYTLSIASGLEFKNIVFGLSFPQTKFVAKILTKLGMKRFMVVAGTDLEGRTIDEISNIGPTEITENLTGKLKTYTIVPQDFGLKLAKYAQIKQGKSISENALLLKQALSGKKKNAAYDAVLLNAGALIAVSTSNYSLSKGIKIAKQTIDSGAALTKLSHVIEKSHG